MDKQSYKELLVETMSELNTAQREIDRLQILVAKHTDEQTKLKKIVYDNPNDMTLGGQLRHHINNTEKKSHQKKK